VTLELPATTGEAAIRFLHGRLVGLPVVKEPVAFLDALLERAGVASVCIASDVALPHARTASFDRHGAGGRSHAGRESRLTPSIRPFALVFLIGNAEASGHRVPAIRGCALAAC